MVLTLPQLAHACVVAVAFTVTADVPRDGCFVASGSGKFPNTPSDPARGED